MISRHCSLSLVALQVLFLPLLQGQSVFLDTSTVGNTATVSTSYGDSIFAVDSGLNITPAFKVEDGQTNWSKDSANPNFSPSADMLPIAKSEVPIFNVFGQAFIDLGFDFNEQGQDNLYDVVNVMMWAGPADIGGVDVATATDPDLSGIQWTGSGTGGDDTPTKWEKNLHVMNNSGVINLIYEQNASPEIAPSGAARPYDGDPHRVWTQGLNTLGSNAVDIAILVPASVLDSVADDQFVYLGVQTGTFADGGSDRFGWLDPDSPGTFIVPIPERSGFLLFSVGLLFSVFRRSR